MNDTYININKIAEIKGLKSTRSLRMAINNGKYKARTIPVNGGYSYEILYSSLEPEVQEKLEDEEIRSTALVPIVDSKPTFISESARMTSLARADIVAALENIKSKYKTKKRQSLHFWIYTIQECYYLKFINSSVKSQSELFGVGLNPLRKKEQTD